MLPPFQTIDHSYWSLYHSCAGGTMPWTLCVRVNHCDKQRFEMMRGEGSTEL